MRSLAKCGPRVDCEKIFDPSGVGESALEAAHIGVGKAVPHLEPPPLPPNRTGGSPASGSPVDDITAERVDGLRLLLSQG